MKLKIQPHNQKEDNMASNIRFITIEGIDGAGKSTTISMIENFLKEKGEEVIITREPGGTVLGESLRKINKEVDMSLMTETLLLFTARAEHVDSKIDPALQAGKWVICDRFTDSTVAYQSYGKGLPEKDVRALENLVQKDTKPALTFILHLPVTQARQRLNSTGKEPDRFEKENNSFFEKVDKGYKEIYRKDPNRCKLVDSSGTVEETNEQIVDIMNAYYKKYLALNPEHRQMKLF